jgi:hypothetical protein
VGCGGGVTLIAWPGIVPAETARPGRTPAPRAGSLAPRLTKPGQHGPLGTLQQTPHLGVGLAMRPGPLDPNTTTPPPKRTGVHAMLLWTCGEVYSNLSNTLAARASTGCVASNLETAVSHSSFVCVG